MYFRFLSSFLLETIYYFYSSFTEMSGNDTKENIQEMEQGEKDFGIINSAQNLHKKVVSNEFVSELDVFSVPVKLTLNGEEVYQTCCGGMMYIMVVSLCVILTVFIMFPNGVQLQSEISVVVVPDDQGDTGQTLFDHTDQIIGFRGIRRSGTTFLGYTNLTGMAKIYAYQVSSDNTTVPLQISRNCNNQYEFCLKKSDQNKNATIFGNFFDQNTVSKYLILQAVWCTAPVTPCPNANSYTLEVSYTNLYKKKGGVLEQYFTKTYFTFTNVVYTLNVTRQIFTSNTKFFGHLSDIFPFKLQTYNFPDLVFKNSLPSSQLKTPGSYTGVRYLQTKILPFANTKKIKQNFDDISDILLFFFSVKETIYLIIFFVLIKEYNRNSGLLEVGSSLYYIDDPKTKKKYDFDSGYEVFIGCMLHNHPLSKFLQFILTKMGKTFEDLLPNKAVCAIKLIRRAEEMLQQNSFYGNLNQLDSMESEALKRIPLFDDGEEQENEQYMEYFPPERTDTQAVKRQKQIKREAFEQFCEANQYLSPDRKNYIYRVLTNSKLKYMLVHQIQKEFKSFIKSVKIQKSDDIYRDFEEEEFSSIKVGLHDTTNHQMTSSILVRK